MSNCPLPHPLTVMLYMSVREPVTLPQQHSGGFLKCVLHLSFTTKWQNGSQLFCHFSRSLSLTWNQELIPPHLHYLPVRFRMISPGLWSSMGPDSPMEPGFITSWELNGDFGAPLTRTWHLPLFSALSMLSRPPAKDIHVHHGDSKEGWRKDLILSSWAKVSLPSSPLFLSDTWAEWYKNN